MILLALLLGGEWLASVWLSVRIGYFAHLAPKATVQALLPGTLLALVLVYMSIVSIACYRPVPHETI